MEYPRAILKATVKIIPFQSKAWCVWEDGEMDGPYDVAALATKVIEVSCDVKPEIAERAGYKGRPYLHSTWDWPEGEPDHLTNEYMDEYGENWVFIPRFADPWTELKRYAFLDEELAKQESATRKATAIAKAEKGEE